MPQAPDIRNVAIIAHVDHGKTTLVDAMLHQSGAVDAHKGIDERAMDSMDQERERGITILAKNASVDWRGTRINIVDTPGHADFGGEVERGLMMVDGALLLVDASEGPLPQTRFVLRKALERELPLLVVINKIDRPDARVAEVLDEVHDLLIELGASDEQVFAPVVYAVARDGQATLDPAEPGSSLEPLMELLLETVPPPEVDPDAPLQALVANLDADPYTGRLAVARVRAGSLRRGQPIALCRAADGRIERGRVAELYLARGLGRVSAEEAHAGDIVAVAGLEDVTIGDTIADPEQPVALDPITVDEPALSMTFGVNTGPMAGRSGSKLTARMLDGRLRAELVGNVSIRVHETELPDVWEVQGRGEMQLAVLVETMRREGFELVVGKPRVLEREVDGVKLEPIERATIDVPEEHVGSITQLMADRRGRMQGMVAQEGGWTRLEYLVPARGLIGIRTRFLTETRGTGMIAHVHEGWEPWAGEIRTRASGSLVADRSGTATAYALLRLEERGTMFVGPGDEVYEGMVVGENSRGEDLDVNAVREKHLTNVRSTADVLVTPKAPRRMGLEEAIEYVREGEAVEVTPDAVRIRKLILGASDRQVARSKEKARQA